MTRDRVAEDLHHEHVQAITRILLGLDAIGQLAEADTLVLHGITMTGPSRRVLWRPETLAVMQEVWRMRGEGIEAHFSIDTGATVYVNCEMADAVEVEDRLGSLGLETLSCTVGGGASLVDDHLF